MSDPITVIKSLKALVDALGYSSRLGTEVVLPAVVNTRWHADVFVILGLTGGI
jgi:hypothetical protein